MRQRIWILALSTAPVLGGIACGDSDPGSGDAAMRDGGAEDAAVADSGETSDSGAGDSGTPTDSGSGEATPVPTTEAMCGIGPISRPMDTGEPCMGDPGPQCPTPPTAGASPYVFVSTCAFGTGETDCTPIGATCPGAALLDFALVNPNGGPPGCNGRVHLMPETMPDGSVTLHWEAFAQENPTCAEIGYAMGDLNLEGPCCAGRLDLYFPHGDFTFRVLVELDWR